MQLPTKPLLRNIAPLLCSAILCVVSGYVLASLITEQLLVNSDSLAPIQASQLLARNFFGEIFKINVARIPSIFPDLINLAGIHWLPIKPQGSLAILVIYAWTSASLFLLLATYLIIEIEQASFKQIPGYTAAICITTIGLAVTSHEMRYALAHLFTPAHHGGNLLNTLVTILVTLKLYRNSNSLLILIAWLSLGFLGVASNKLFIFTAFIPIIIIFVLRSEIRKTPILHIILFMAACAAGWHFSSLLNVQCAPAFSLNLKASMQAFQQYLQMGWIPLTSSLLSAVMAIASISKLRGCKSIQLNHFSGLALISLSTLSFYAYFPLLTSNGEAPLRYALILFGNLPLLIFICTDIACQHDPKRRTALLSILGLSALIFAPKNYRMNTPLDLTQATIQALRRHKPLENDIINFAMKNDLDSSMGFSDYWGAGITMMSNDRLSVIPIHPSGFADFWSLSPGYVDMVASQKETGINYVVSTNTVFSNEIRKNFGKPDQSYGYDSKNRVFKPGTSSDTAEILIYNNNRIKSLALKSSRTFVRQCDRSKEGFRER